VPSTSPWRLSRQRLMSSADADCVLIAAPAR
jgi:hypothetical protein